MRSITGLTTFFAALVLSACGGSSDEPSLGSPPGPPGGGGTPGVAVSQVFTGLSFTNPTVLRQAPGDDTRWFVGEKRGFIRVFANNPSSSSAEMFLDISADVNASGEGGLLGFAFHPDFPITPEVFVSYTRSGAPLVSYVSRFFSTDNGQTLLAGSEEVILTVLQPQSNHNGGDIHFGPDGNLYISFGDGGGSGDPLGNGQDDTNLHGTIVRIDVDGAAPYEIPPSNPNALNATCAQGYGAAPCAEIFAWGLRNPWRMSFDTVTGKLWAGEVGQGAGEEIDVIAAGENYGWNGREGADGGEPAVGCARSGSEPVSEDGGGAGGGGSGG